MFGSIGRSVAWFIDGLVEAWIAAADRLRRRRRIALVRSAGGYAVDGRPENDVLSRQAGDSGYFFAPTGSAAALRDRDIDLVLSADEVLVRTLDPLPGESRPYLDSIVHHQLERVAPWRADDVLHTYRAAPLEPDRVSVTVIATARSMHAQVLEALRALRPREIRLMCHDEQFGGEAVAIPVDHGAATAARHARLRGRIAAAVALLALAVVGGAGLLGWGLYRADTELDAVAQQITAQRQRLMAARPTTQGADQDIKAMVERRWKTPFAVLALEALAQALPDDTWLTDLRISENRVRMTGISQSVPELVPQIGESSAFADATFFAPTARLPGGQGDRFHLEARMLPMERP